ncbi:MAG: hypothetical protein ACON4E_02470 [Flavobacteriales bacterium]
MKLYVLMILIADSGSTKTDWCLVKNGKEVKRIQTIGLNPFTINSDSILKTISQLELNFLEIRKVFFYGAGCGNNEKKSQMLFSLKHFFKNADIHVYSDLLAVARALLKTESGYIGILGTGSNVAYFDGENIQPVCTSLGYLLGDEGSGNYLGKQFLKHFILGKFKDEILSQINLNKHNILSDLYSSETPNRYLASFSPLIHQLKSFPQVRDLIYQNFNDWIMLYLIPNSITTIQLCGSIAYYYEDELKSICHSNNIIITSVIKKPITQLVIYHSEN